MWWGRWGCWRLGVAAAAVLEVRGGGCGCAGGNGRWCWARNSRKMVEEDSAAAGAAMEGGERGSRHPGGGRRSRRRTAGGEVLTPLRRSKPKILMPPVKVKERIRLNISHGSFKIRSYSK